MVMTDCRHLTFPDLHYYYYVVSLYEVELFAAPNLSVRFS